MPMTLRTPTDTDKPARISRKTALVTAFSVVAGGVAVAAIGPTMASIVGGQSPATVELAASHINPASPLTISGSGYSPGALVYVKLTDPAGVPNGAYGSQGYVADANGAVAITLDAPSAGWTSGAYKVGLYQNDALTAETALTVDGGVPAPTTTPSASSTATGSTTATPSLSATPSATPIAPTLTASPAAAPASSPVPTVAPLASLAAPAHSDAATPAATVDAAAVAPSKSPDARAAVGAAGQGATGAGAAAAGRAEGAVPAPAAATHAAPARAGDATAATSGAAPAGVAAADQSRSAAATRQGSGDGLAQTGIEAYGPAWLAIAGLAAGAVVTIVVRRKRAAQ